MLATHASQIALRPSGVQSVASGVSGVYSQTPVSGRLASTGMSWVVEQAAPPAATSATRISVRQCRDSVFRVVIDDRPELALDARIERRHEKKVFVLLQARLGLRRPFQREARVRPRVVAAA